MPGTPKLSSGPAGSCRSCWLAAAILSGQVPSHQIHESRWGFLRNPKGLRFPTSQPQLERYRLEIDQLMMNVSLGLYELAVWRK